MHLKIRKYRSGYLLKKRGQATLEFVLVIPMIILVTLVVIQLGYFVYIQNILEQAAREGIRVLSTTNSDAGAVGQILGVCSGLEEKNISIDISPANPSEREVGRTARVVVHYGYGGIGGFLGFITGKDFLLKAECFMRMECNG